MPRMRPMNQADIADFADIVELARYRGRSLFTDQQLDFLEGLIETKPDILAEAETESSRDYWMNNRFFDHLQINPDEDYKKGCWIWTGAPDGTRPVYRYKDKTLPVRVKMLEIWQKFIPPAKSRISVTCGSPLCVRPEHLIAMLPGRGVIWPMRLRDDPELKRQLVQQSNDDLRARHAGVTPPLDRPLELPPLEVAYRTLPDDEFDQLLQSEWERVATETVIQEEAELELLSNCMCEQTLDLQIQLEHLAARLG